MTTTVSLLKKIEDAIEGRPNTCSSEHIKTLEMVRDYLRNDIAIEAHAAPPATPTEPPSPHARIEVKIRAVYENDGLERELAKHTFYGGVPDDWEFDQIQAEYDDIYESIAKVLQA